MQQYGLTVTDGPDTEPVTLAEAIEFLREDEDLAQSDLIEGLIAAARQWSEEFLGRALVNTGYTMTLDRFHDVIYLPRSKVQSVSAIRYIDENGDQQTLATSKYRVDSKSLVGRITPAYSECWPTIRPVINAVEIDFVAGYGEDADAVPAAIKQAIKYMVTHWYEIRETVVVGSIATKVPLTARSLLAPYRVEIYS